MIWELLVQLAAAFGATVGFAVLVNALPREFVDSRKQQRLRSAAEMYLSQQELDAPARFDVAEVYEENGQLRINYIENAFI